MVPLEIDKQCESIGKRIGMHTLYYLLMVGGERKLKTGKVRMTICTNEAIENCYIQ